MQIPPQTYSDPSPMYNLPPINPGAFGALPQEGPPQEGPPQEGPPQGGGQPQAGGPPPPGGEAPMDMNKYLIDKVIEIKRRMTGEGGGVGALSAISNAMMDNQSQNPTPAPEQMRA